jgi:hypothetical protein
MTERIDYNYNAQERVKVALKDPDQSNALVTAQIATAEALIALTEQQRIANLIALSQAQDGNGWQAAEPLEAIFGYLHPDPEDGFEGLHIRREIREGLGLS